MTNVYKSHTLAPSEIERLRKLADDLGDEDALMLNVMCEMALECFEARNGRTPIEGDVL